MSNVSASAPAPGAGSAPGQSPWDAFASLLGTSPAWRSSVPASHQRHTAPCTLHPIMVSASQSPYPVAVSTSAGRSAMGRRLAISGRDVPAMPYRFCVLSGSAAPVDLATLLLVSQDPLVDPFVAYRVLALFEHAADLFPSSSLPAATARQTRRTTAPMVDAACPWLTSADGSCARLRLPDNGHAAEWRRSSPADHAFTATDALTNRGRAKPFCIQCLDLVSFTFGRLTLSESAIYLCPKQEFYVTA